MGFFSSNKEVNKKVSATTAPMPPAPSVGSAAPTTNSSSVSNAGKLTPPPVPANPQLEEIKTEITSGSETKTNSNNNNNGNSFTNTQNNFSVQNKDNESLFDLSDLDITEPELNVEKTNEGGTEGNDKDMNVNSEVPKEDMIDPDDENISRLSYRHSETKRGEDKDIYITTSQFKTLFSVINSVKEKVKEASETHLRLTDIKSEEDIEYENLRKTFHFIEDKLYEVDGLIFEK